MGRVAARLFSFVASPRPRDRRLHRQSRQLLYAVPHGAGFLAVRLEAGEPAFPTPGKRSDLWLASLRFKD